MLKVLSDPANKSKISQTVVGAVNTSIELPLRGPLLLYALMENDESYKLYQKYGYIYFWTKYMKKKIHWINFLVD